MTNTKWLYAPQSPLHFVLDCMSVSVLPWFDYSPLGESVTAGMECILGSAMYLKSTGMSLKKGRALWVHFKTVKHQLRAQHAQPRSKNSKEKHSQSCLFTIMLSQKCSLLKKKTPNSFGEKLGRITITATACKQLHAFWYCTTDCTGIQLFINPFPALFSLLLYALL